MFMIKINIIIIKNTKILGFFAKKRKNSWGEKKMPHGAELPWFKTRLKPVFNPFQTCFKPIFLYNFSIDF